MSARNATERNDRTLERPIFIVTCARSGSTLLSQLLDAHPDVACPAESGFAAALARQTNVWHVLVSSHEGVAVHEPSEEVVEEIRGSGEAMMRYYCAAEGKRRFCDKSLDTIDYLPLLSSIFPQARFVFLYRHVMDVIASGIEACPWGFGGYGFASFVQANPWNFVAALAQYWLTFVERALAYEREHASDCVRLRYEDLVQSPEVEMRRVLHRLGLDWHPRILEEGFDRDKAPGLPGDFKITFTDRIHQESLGRGRRVPIELLPDQLLGTINSSLEQLEYEELGPEWNVALPNEERLRQVAMAGTDDITALLRDHGDVAIATAAVSGRLAKWKLPPGASVGLRVDGDSRTWKIDFGEGKVDCTSGPVDPIVAGEAKALLELAAGGRCAELMRSGAVRYYQTGGATDGEGIRVLGAVADVLQQAHINQARS